MASQAPGPVPVNNETFSTSSRITREGRKITYRAQVIQQPERARACGAGAKSCADRRPVDPPPIVELKIFEGPPGSEKDITTQYNANFFVFATLENARVIAHGRVPGGAQTLPVLTGSPVAGMALLERPDQAGYFIFPDLSVRHEGKYRLTFSLYEELKDTKDYDSETPENSELLRSAHVSHRLEVKTKPFTVFSAKKFPGLSESTSLSKIFAEQGCRVRIRREVRQRKGVPRKAGADDEDDFQPDYASQRRTSATPDIYSRPPVTTPHDSADRARSGSILSNGNLHTRRESGESMASHHQGPYAGPPPQSPQAMYPPQGQWQQQPQPAQNGFMPPQANHQPQYSAAPPPPPAQSMAPPQFGYPPPQPNYAPPAPPAHADAYHNRSNSIGYQQAQSPAGPPPQGPPRTTTPQAQLHHGAPPPQYQHYPQPSYQPQYSQPPQLSPVQAPPHHSPTHPLPPTPGYGRHMHIDAAPQPSHPPVTSPQSSQFGLATTNKRAYGSTFDTQAMEQPLRQGARPNPTSMDPKYNYRMETDTALSNDDEEPFDMSAMSYRRADGTERRRRVPVHN